MNIFLSDLDNTLIFSHRKKLSGKKLVTEYLNGREQSYMTEKTLLMLSTFCSLEGNILVPLTTRTFKQYDRLKPFSDALGIRTALISNGAVLLENGKPDPEWLMESHSIAEPFYEDIKKSCSIMKEFVEESHVHFIEPFMSYCRPPSVDEPFAMLKKEFEGTDMMVISSSGKLYCLPKLLSKGNAVRRFIRRKAAEGAGVFAAGDSEFDISMLQEAEYAFVPEKNKELFRNIQNCIPVSGVFSEGLCERLIRLSSAVHSSI